MSSRNNVLPSPATVVFSLAAVLLLSAGSPPLQAQVYTPLTGLRVSAGGGVQYLFASAVAGCIQLSNTSVGGVVYTVHTSKWQRRAGTTWVDIAGTERGGLCAYSPTSPGEYRLVAEITIGGERGRYASENTLTVEGTTGIAPADQAAFNALVVGRRMLSSFPASLYHVDFVEAGRFEETEGAATYAGSYSYSNTGPDTGTVVFNYDDGDRCTYSVTFESPSTGSLTYTCNEGMSGETNWRLVEDPDYVPVTPPETGTIGVESFDIPNLGGWSTTSSGTEVATRSGYGRIRAEAGSTTPSGIAIFGFRQGGVLIAEAGVPASEPVQEGRIFAEVNDPVNTGLAIANPNDAPATILFHFTDDERERFAEGQFELGAHEQTAKFLDQEPFNSGEVESGTFTFTSSMPIAVVALRGLTNRDDEFLMTTLPVAPLASTSTDTVYFPHFTDGDGWVTQVILVNPTDETIAGKIQFVGQGSATAPAAPAILTLDDDRTGSEFPYSIPARGSQRFTTSNPSGRVTSGSVRATPDDGSVAPSGLVVFSYTTGGKTVSEVGVNALTAGSAFRVYAESSGTPNQPGSIRTGLALTNAADAVNTVTLEVTGLDGKLAMGVAPATLPLPASGQTARFLDEIFDSLPPDFSGVLRVTSTADVAIVGLRLRINDRGELKMTTTPPSIETGPPVMGDKFFPHIVDSAGWSTQFILFSGTAGQASSGTLSFFDTAGKPWDLPTATVQAADTSPSFGAATVGNQSYQAGTAISPLTLPAASGGDGTLTYSLSPNVPGLTFNATARVLAGTPTNAGSYGMTYTVRDADGDIATLNFVVTVVTTPMATVDLVVTSVSASDDTLESGQSFDLRATVRNAGTGASTATTLRYYRSTDATISTADTEVGTDTVGALTAAGTSDESIDLTAPSTPGTYYYGACVDPVSGESDTGNNCSSAVRGTVGDSQTEIDSFDLDSDSRYPRGITFANDRFYVVDDHYPNSKVFVYRATGQRDSASDFDLDSENGNPEGITFANDRFYVVDGYPGRKVYVYHASGQRDSASDFDLDSDNGNPEGITFANDTFYVIDLYEGKAFAHQASGQRDSASDFDLDSDNRYPSGITFANDRFYVVGELRGGSDNKVYAYQADGERDSASDFNLDSDNRQRSGITFANDRFYVIDDADRKVYVIDKSTHQLPDLVLTSASVSDNTPTSGESFVFRATVRNRGTLASAATTLRYYRSDSTLADGRGGFRLNLTTATEVGSDAVGALAPSETSSQMISLTTPSTAGTYYYGACVDSVSGESNTGNNCSSPVQVTVRPDLRVRSSVSETTLTSGDSFVLTATVRNGGNIASAATTLHFYRSDDRAISTADMEVGTDAVSALAPSETSSKMISLTAPSTSGTYYYGACVDYVSGESNSRNNCSLAVQVTVRAILPDLTVESPSVSNKTPASGDSFEFTATVRNQGLSASTATTLRYYLSEDTTITSRDTEVGMDAVSALSVDETSSATISLPAPSTEGTYYYGACVDPVSEGEISTENNCSSAVTVFGGGPFPTYDLEISRSVLHAPGVVVIGQSEISMTVDVTNNGPNASRPAKLRFSGGLNVILSIPVLEPNETVTFERQRVGYARLGTTTYRACIEEAPGEENTGNNCASRSVTYRLQ